MAALEVLQNVFQRSATNHIFKNGNSFIRWKIFSKVSISHQHRSKSSIRLLIRFLRSIEQSGKRLFPWINGKLKKLKKNKQTWQKSLWNEKSQTKIMNFLIKDIEMRKFSSKLKMTSAKISKAQKRQNRKFSHIISGLIGFWKRSPSTFRLESPRFGEPNSNGLTRT